ncbi:MAG: PAS domain S-box protein [Caldilineaceae bacterium]|nr:PAS domain S-box protein [Caldilineaceae bacterium]
MQLQPLPIQQSQNSPFHELQQLQASYRNEFLDNSPERTFDRLTRFACRLLQTPIAFITLIDGEQQVVKSSQGLPAPWSTAPQLPLTALGCAEVVRTPNALIIPDLRTQPHFAETLASLAFPHQAYLGLPLVAHHQGAAHQEIIGCFCVIDHQPHAWSETDLDTLQELGAAVLDALAWRASQADLHLALEGGQIGTWRQDPASQRIDYNPQARTLLGLADAPFYTTADFWAVVYPPDHPIIERECEAALTTQHPYTLEFRVQPKGEDLRWLQVRGRSFHTQEGLPWRVAGVMQEITERKRAEARLLLQHAVAKVLTEAQSFAAARQALLAAFCQSLQLDLGEFWRPDPQTNALQCRTSHTPLADVTPSPALAPSATLPSHVWQTQAPYWITDRPEDSSISLASALPTSFASGFAFPVLQETGCLGIFVFYTRQRLTPDPELLEILRILGRTLGQFVQRCQQAALQHEQEAQLQVALLAAHVGTWEIDLHSRQVIRSDSMDVLYGLPPDGTPRKIQDYMARVHPDDRPRFSQALRNATENHTEYSVEYRIPLADGTLRWIASRGQVVRDEAGQATKLQGGLVDITQRKAAEAQMLSSEQHLRNVINSLFAFVGVMTPEGLLIEVNRPALEAANLQPGDVLGKPFEETYWWSYSAEVQTQLRATIQRAATGETMRYDVTVRLAENQYIIIDFMLSPIRDEAGVVTYLVPSAIDVTERKLIAQALQVSEERFRNTFDQAAVGIAHVAIDGTWLRVNQRLCDIIGYPQEELRQTNFQQITHPADLAPDLAQLTRLLAGEIPGYQLEKRYFHRSGAIVWVNLTVSLVHTAEGEPDYFIAVLEDIQDRKAAEAALRRSEAELRCLNETLELHVAERTAELQERNRELDQFAYVASHDLKAPLRAIDNLASWLMEDVHPLLPAQSQEHLQKLRGRVTRMEKLLDDLLAYSRIGRQRGVAEQIDTRALLRVITEMVVPPEFTVILQEPLPMVYLERIPLETTLRNLVDNAIKHYEGTPTAGRIELSVQEVGSMVEFTITDNGPGIDAQFHERIFSMFQTLKPRDQVEGSGMGLAIVKKIVESRGGTIQVESTAGAGATFRLRWPRA